MCCGRRTSGSQPTSDPTEPRGATSGPAAGTYTVTNPGGGTVVKTSEIAARLYVATHPGATYVRN